MANASGTRGRQRCQALCSSLGGRKICGCEMHCLRCSERPGLSTQVYGWAAVFASHLCSCLDDWHVEWSGWRVAK